MRSPRRNSGYPSRHREEYWAWPVNRPDHRVLVWGEDATEAREQGADILRLPRFEVQARLRHPPERKLQHPYVDPPWWGRNPSGESRGDARARDLQRRAALEVTPEAEAAVLKSRLRSGELETWHVEMLSFLGYAPAQVLVPQAELHAMVGEPRPRGVWPVAWAAQRIAPRRVQAMIARAVAVGAALEVERLAYLPLLDHARLFHPQNQLSELPIELLRNWAALAWVGQNVGAGNHSFVNYLNEYVVFLYELGNLDDADADDLSNYNGESAMADYTFALTRLAELMRGVRETEDAWRLARRVIMLLREALQYAADLAAEGFAPTQDALDACTTVGAGFGPLPTAIEATDRVLTNAYTRYLTDWLLTGPRPL